MQEKKREQDKNMINYLKIILKITRNLFKIIIKKYNNMNIGRKNNLQFHIWIRIMNNFKESLMKYLEMKFSFTRIHRYLFGIKN